MSRVLVLRNLQVAYLIRCITLAGLVLLYSILTLSSVSTYNMELIRKYAFIRAWKNSEQRCRIVVNQRFHWLVIMNMKVHLSFSILNCE